MNYIAHQFIGWKIQNRLTINEIQDRLFESVREMTSTRGRMFALKRWDVN